MLAAPKALDTDERIGPFSPGSPRCQTCRDSGRRALIERKKLAVLNAVVVYTGAISSSVYVIISGAAPEPIFASAAVKAVVTWAPKQIVVAPEAVDTVVPPTTNKHVEVVSGQLRAVKNIVATRARR